MRHQLDTLRHLMQSNTLDIKAVSSALEDLPTSVGAEIAVVVEQARRSIAAVRTGNKRYRPLLRHAIGRLIELLEKRAAFDVPQSE